MPDMRVNEGVKLTGLPEGWANAHALQRVILWDVGPEKPKPPVKPALPEKGKSGDPEYELAKVEFEQALDDYRAALKDYKRLRDEYTEWHTRNGGPIELDFWSCDATDALGRDAAAVKNKKNPQEKPRYYLSSRTRGYGHLPNRGLPEGLRPGHGQAELERRMREGDEDLATALRKDPVFGQQELRQ